MNMVIIIAIVAVILLLVAVVVVMLGRSKKKASDDSVKEELETKVPEPEFTEEKPETKESEPEPEKPEPEKKEEPKEYLKPVAAATAAVNTPEKKEPNMNGDFLSKLVASKDASDKAAEVPYWVPPTSTKAPVESKEAEPEPKPIEEKPEPVKEEPAAVEEVAEIGDESIDSESDDDTYTDYSPEALVRRAAWNKGLRCRRQYGDHSIQVAFVKPKVAVYVLDPSEVIPEEDKVKEEGWTVLRFDMGKVTDGLSEGDEIAEAVKVNLHAQKASKKKSGKK